MERLESRLLSLNSRGVGAPNQRLAGTLGRAWRRHPWLLMGKFLLLLQI
jgi:hypothetical protein